MGRLIDLSGQRFGRLIVLNRGIAKGKSKEAWWHCLCDCGQEVDVRGHSLRKGETQSCGCLHKEKISEKTLKDLTGQTFCRLTVISKVGKDKNGHSIWSCKCLCGSVINVLGTNLLKGNTKSCGCLESSGEERVAQILSKMNIPFEREFSFPDLVSKTGFPLRFDFKIGDNLIEVQGKQHYSKSDFFGGEIGFQSQQERDLLKRNYCLNNNYNLIEIPYQDFESIDEIYLKERMIGFGKKNI